jgi:uncharacterized membrane protein
MEFCWLNLIFVLISAIKAPIRLQKVHEFVIQKNLIRKERDKVHVAQFHSSHVTGRHAVNFSGITRKADFRRGLHWVYFTTCTSLLRKMTLIVWMKVNVPLPE